MRHRLVDRIVFHQQHARAGVLRIRDALLGYSGCRLARDAACNSGQQLVQLGFAHRLRQPRRHAQSLRFSHAVSERAQHDARCVLQARSAAQLAQEPHPIHFRHLVVEQHHIERGSGCGCGARGFESLPS